MPEVVFGTAKGVSLVFIRFEECGPLVARVDKRGI